MKVIHYPYTDNPYIDKISKSQYYSSYVLDLTQKPYFLRPFYLFINIFFLRINNYTIFHIHWMHTFILPLSGKLTIIGKLISTLYFILVLILLKLLGYKIVWTVHNILPHKSEFINDRFVYVILSTLSDAKIIHSDHTKYEMFKNGYSINNINRIPIGNFIGDYPNCTNKLLSRKRLNLRLNKFVLLFFGRVEQYKGISKLLDLFLELNIKNTELIIVGKSRDQELSNVLNKSKSNKVLINLNYINTKDVQYYFNAADIIVIPYTSNTSSSTALLSFAFKRPIIAPLLGNILDFPKGTGFYYDPKDNEGLKNSIMDSISRKNDLSKMGKEAYYYAKSLSWEMIRKKTYKVYKDVLGK